MDFQDYSIIIIGAGPAGLSLATALARRAKAAGAAKKVALVSPVWPVEWVNNFGVWQDELAFDEELLACVSHTYTQPQIILPSEQRPRALGRTYVKVDNAAMSALFVRRFEEADGVKLVGKVTSVRHDSLWSTVELCSDAESAPRNLRAHLVIDATGNEPRFVRRQPGTNPGYQIAYGVHARVKSAPKGWLSSMRLMDWRSAAGASADVDGLNEKPSFLYGMQLSEDEVFVEETSLVARPGMLLEELQQRLERRLKREGVVLDEPLACERCVIPMGHNLPDFSQRTLGYGGAASMVHPATGYQVAGALSRAPDVAHCLMDLIEKDGFRGMALSSRAWKVVWPEEARLKRELYMYGMELLLGMGLRELDAFYQAFFEWPDHLWQGYLSDQLSHTQLMEAMALMLVRLKGRHKLELIKPAWVSSENRGHLVRGVFQGALNSVLGVMNDRV